MLGKVGNKVRYGSYIAHDIAQGGRVCALIERTDLSQQQEQILVMRGLDWVCVKVHLRIPFI